MTPTQRAEKSKRARIDAGGKVINIPLAPEPAEALGALVAHFGSIRGAVEAAILAMAASLKK